MLQELLTTPLWLNVARFSFGEQAGALRQAAGAGEAKQLLFAGYEQSPSAVNPAGRVSD